MENTHNTNSANQSANNNPANGDRTFTQDEVNRIIGERLAKEKSKGDAALAERERQFEERERQLANREAVADLKDKLKEMGLPGELLPVLNVQDKEALNKALEALQTVMERKQEDNKEYTVLEPHRLNKPNVEYKEPSLADQLRKAMHL